VWEELDFSEGTRDMKAWNGWFYDDFDVCSTFFKFKPFRTNDDFSPLWVTRELNFSEGAGDNLSLLFYGTTQNDFSPLLDSG